MADIFNSDALQRQIDIEFAAIPAGKSGALVAYWTTAGVWRVAVATKIGDHWTLGGVAQVDAARGNIVGGLQIRATWP